MACDAKDIQSCFDLAALHQAGAVTGWVDPDRAALAFQRGIHVDQQKALAINQKACDPTSGKGCFNLALMHEKGWGVASSPQLATQLFQKACDASDPAACYHLACLRYLGYAGQSPANAAEAVRLLNKACAGKDAIGCFALASLHKQSGSWPASARFYLKACDLRFAQGCYEAGVLYDRRIGGLKGRPKGVADLYSSACDARVASACLNLAEAHWVGVDVQKDWPKAVAYYERACDLGDAVGCLGLGERAENGWGTQKDHVRAAQVYDKGCTIGLANSCSHLAALYQAHCDAGEMDQCVELGTRLGTGRGLAKDEARAGRLFRKACDSGLVRGCNELEKLNQAGNRE